jgi:two-component system chemotaxis response regulator CheB
MDKTGKVLVVDDSAFMRKMVSDILRQADLDVIATAYDGLDALDKVRKLHPDVITLDIEMPRMDGVSFLRELMRTDPTPVVVLSSLTAEGADATLQCLELGAFDCLRKPSGAISLDIESISKDIARIVKEAIHSRVGVQRTGRPASLAHHLVKPAQRDLSNEKLSPARGEVTHKATPVNATYSTVVLIASSTGGPAALQRVIPLLPANLGAPVMLVQHLPVGFTASLAQRLDNVSNLVVREAKEGDQLSPNVVLVAPAGRHLAFDERRRVVLNNDPPLWGVRPAADVMFLSAAERFGSGLVAVVMTGMGKDGSLGAKMIRRKGGICIAQDEASCVIYGMPKAALEAGGVDKLAPLDSIAGEIVEAVKQMERSRPIALNAK